MKSFRRKCFALIVIIGTILLVCVITYKKLKSELNTSKDSQEHKVLQDILLTKIVNSWRSRTTSENNGENSQTNGAALTSIIPSRGIYETIPFNNSLSILDTIYISVKTSTKFHNDRLAPLLVTWMQPLNPDQVIVCTITYDRLKTDIKMCYLTAIRDHFRQNTCDLICEKTTVKTPQI